MEKHYKYWQQVEGGVVFLALLAIVFLVGFEMPVWVAVLIFFSPDLSFLAYLAGAKIGGFVYNIVHNYGFGAVVIFVGVFSQPGWIGVGLLFVAHRGFDRMLGYGLKSSSAFTQTHMGEIGK